jgi:hypothetical protein
VTPPTRLGISVGDRLDRLTIEISAQEFGARAYIRRKFRFFDQLQWAGFTYDAYREAADSASDVTCCVAVKLNNRQERFHAILFDRKPRKSQV